MKRLLTILILVTTPFIMGAKGGGCSSGKVPTMAQIRLYLPESIRTCKYAPRSPGRTASRAQRAKYIAGLYAAWEDCHGDLATVNRLYKKWQNASE